MTIELQYKFSTYPSKRSWGYHQIKRKQNFCQITLYLSSIWKSSHNYAEAKGLDEFKVFIHTFVHVTLIERICLETRLQKLKIRNRCKPCKIEKYAVEMLKE